MLPVVRGSFHVPVRAMPYHVLLSSAEGFGSIGFTGMVGWPEVEAALRAVFSHPDWDPAFCLLWDAREIDGLHIAPTDLPAMRAAMEDVAPARGGGRSALLARDDVEATLAVLLTRLGPPTGRRVGTFYRLEDALAFLGREAVPGNAEVIATG